MDNDPVVLRLNVIIALLVAILGLTLFPIISTEIVAIGVVTVAIVFPLVFLAWIHLR